MSELVVQIDGKLAAKASGQIRCEAVCIIPGKLINIITKLKSPNMEKNEVKYDDISRSLISSNPSVLYDV